MDDHGHAEHIASGDPAAIAVELVLLAALAGSLGTWIVLRRLAFFAHAVGTATFPGLVAAGTAGGIASAALAGAGVRGLRGMPRLGTDAATGLVLGLAIAVGVLIAREGDVHPEDLLFGDLAVLGWREVAVTAVATLAVGAVALVRHRRWLADALADRAPDALLLACVAAGSIAAVDAVGALLVAAVLVIPPATARLFARDVRSLAVLAAGIALVETAAAWGIADAADAGAGGVLAVLGGAVYALAALVRRPA